jgi:hypothetical protein
VLRFPSSAPKTTRKKPPVMLMHTVFIRIAELDRCDPACVEVTMEVFK